MREFERNWEILKEGIQRKIGNKLRDSERIEINLKELVKI